jgi:hypothetical protein
MLGILHADDSPQDLQKALNVVEKYKKKQPKVNIRISNINDFQHFKLENR